MRKTFKFFCAAAVAALTVSSCGKIWDEFDEVHGEIDGLDARITELESKLNSQVEAINMTIGTLNEAVDAVEAKVAVVAVVKKDNGNYLLTFSNGETLEIAGADPNANNTGLVTTVTEDGVTYWAVLDKDGKVTKLNAAVHPSTKLQFKIDPETNELYVSYDGKDYEPTGVIVNDETTFNIVENFVDAEDYVVLTVGGIEYKLPKVSANYFHIVSGMQYFMPSETKTIVVDMDGVVSSMIASAPAGWSATLTEKDGLKITAPAGEYDEMWGEFWGNNQTDEGSGDVVVWVVTEDGQTKVGTVNVAIAGTPATYAFAENFTKVSVTFSSAYNGQAGVYFGVCEADKYDAAAVVESVKASMKTLASGVFTNYDFETGNYLSKADYKFAELLGAAPEVAAKYVFWSVAPEIKTLGWDEETYMPITEMDLEVEDIVLDYVTVYSVTVGDTKVAFNDATLDVTVAGAEEFYIGYAYGPKEQYFGENGALSEDNLAYYKESMNIDLKKLLIEGLPGWMPSMPNEMITKGGIYKGEYKGRMTDLYEESIFDPGNVATVFVLPLPAGKIEFTVEDLTCFEVKLPELKTGGDATVTFGSPTNISYNSFCLPIEATGERTYYSVVDAATYEYAKDMLVDKVLENIQYYTAKDEKSFVLEVNEDFNGMPLNLNTKYVVLAFSVAADASCGSVVVKEVTTGDISFTDALSVTSIVGSAANESASAEITITGSATKVYYRICLVDWCPTEEEYKDQVFGALSGSSYDWYSLELTEKNFVDGKVTIDDLYVGNAKDRVILAFVEDKDGNVSKIAKSNVFHDATQE